MQNSLNDKQIQAINTYDDNLLILAGAGTGKTLTITTRISNLILNGICNAEDVLAVTFTNKAAGEMKERIEKLVGSDVSKMWIGTFHSISARIIRNFATALSLQPNFLILDEYDKKKLLSGVIKDLEIDEKRFPVKICQYIISQLKGKCISCYDEEKISNFKFKDLDIVNLYQTYQKRLREMNAVDFDDLIFECVNLFKKNPRILEDLQQRFRYITVDEYQDTNEIQHLWLRLLVGSNNNICCVGDEDQSIYGWRGAKVDYILNFKEDFLNSKIIRLEQNYRSTEPVLKAAMSVISNNKQRYDKVLKSNIYSNDLPNLIIVENDRDENNNIVANINELHINNVDYKNIAILVRASHQMRGIEDCFIKNNIPYKIIGGIKFYERKEIKDIVAYIRWCYSLKDKISLERIINLPKRGIGEKTFNDIISYTEKSNIELIDGLNNVANFGDILNDKQKITIRSFLEFSFTIHNQFLEKDLSIDEIIEKIYFNSGYSEMLENGLKEDPENENRIENIRELISSSKQFENIEQFLEHISLMSSNDDKNDTNSVNVMTMHASKGLEFLYVFLPSWDTGIFPSQKAIDEEGNKGLEEERRLAYVAITRARKNFYVYTAKQRMTFGRVQLCQPSIFIDEMKYNLKKIDLTYNKTSFNCINKNNFRFNNKFDDYNIQNTDVIKAKQDLINGVSKKNFFNSSGINHQTTNYYAEQEKKDKVFKVGDLVYSEKFGEGVIKTVYGKFYEVQFKDTKQITKDIIKKK